ncbi:alpha/beta hydrolase family protein [Paenibacillus ferrarius]|uniref:alpha/beta hydrolase family protein n=1 Tax=Paenibacillus ferrarius TaxID=1469647 RepID=UPI003D28CD88
MGILLLCIALSIEIVFAVYCLATKQNHRRLKHGVRMSELLGFTVLLLTPAITWNFRWIFLEALLVLLGVIAAVSLVRKKLPIKSYSSFRNIRNAVLMSLAFLIACTPAILFPPYKELQATGEYTVASKTFTYTDPNRIEAFTTSGKNRQVNVQFWYPEETDNKYPLLVFSHGANGVKSSNVSTFKELASHGYVVCSIDHPYHSFYTVSDTGEFTLISQAYMKEVQDANKDGVYTPKEVYALMQNWMKLRTDDIDFVIDTVLKQSPSGNPSVYSLIDANHIGVFGHSMGAAASVAVGRSRHDVEAVVNLDGPYFSELRYDPVTNNFAASDQPYTTPLLNIYTDDVWKQLGTNPVYAANHMAKETFKDAYSVYFKGAKHLSLTDLALVSPPLANFLQGGKAAVDPVACIKAENQLILQFFDYTLKGGAPFKFPAEVEL